MRHTANFDFGTALVFSRDIQWLRIEAVGARAIELLQSGEDVSQLVPYSSQTSSVNSSSSSHGIESEVFASTLLILLMSLEVGIGAGNRSTCRGINAETVAGDNFVAVKKVDRVRARPRRVQPSRPSDGGDGHRSGRTTR